MDKARQMCVDDNEESPHESPHELARQSEAKRRQAYNLEKTSLRKGHRAPNNAQNTQHKLGIAFAYLKRNES